MQGPGEKVTVSQPQTPCDWYAIDWRQATAYVRALRQAIFRATKGGDLKKVRTLQRIMLRSWENRVLAVRRVTQTNRGRNTPGVDKVVVKTPEARGQLVDRLAACEPWKPLPARRVYIPKKANSDELRPLGIPVVLDRALQAVVKNALEPYWEALFEDCSYGFRPGRGCHDAIERVFNLASAKGNRPWVLDADIKGAFDNIDHDKLLEVIGNFPARELVRQWLKAGCMEGLEFHPTPSGTPQGGVISPLLANIALHGMEGALGIKYRDCPAKSRKGLYASELHPDSVGLVRYADDFVVFCKTREEAEQVREKLRAWLAERGLEFSPKKTRIVNLDEGFDFLGFNVRQYKVSNSRTGRRLLIRPSKKAVREHARKLKALFREGRGKNGVALTILLNPVIKGWAEYYRPCVAARIFEKLDHYLFKLQKRWVIRSHPEKPWKWRRKRYWGKCKYHPGDDQWVFVPHGIYMRKHAWTPIKRHRMVRRFSSWDDPDLQGYWDGRSKRATADILTTFQRKIAKRQDWACPVCGDYLSNGEELHEHHKVQRRNGGSNHPDNLTLLHLYCHQAVHGRKEAPTD